MTDEQWERARARGVDRRPIARTSDPGRPATVRAVDRETGAERWTRTKSRAIEGPDGEVLYTVTAIEDVTDVKRAELSQRLLARAGEIVEHSSSHDRMLKAASRLLVPEFADWCALSVSREDGAIETVAFAHREPEREPVGLRLGRLYPGWIGDDAAIAAALETGEPQVVVVRRRRRRCARAARDDEHFDLLRELGVFSAYSFRSTPAAGSSA